MRSEVRQKKIMEKLNRAQKLWLRLSLAMAEMDVAGTENSQLLVGGLANSQIFPD